MKHIYCLMIFICFHSLHILAQQSAITGKVTAPDGMPLQGVSVAAGDANVKAVALTNAEGLFAISIPSGVSALVFSYVGMQTLTEQIAGRPVINLRMMNANTQLEGVVVTALGIRREVPAVYTVAISRQLSDDAYHRCRLSGS